MPTMEGSRERHWIDGFKRLKDTWPRVQQVIADGNRDGTFNAFLGFEWHSSKWGDQCVVFPEDHRPLFYTPDPAKLRAFCVEERALMIPHHLAYPSGNRGVNWTVFDECCTPVVEIYSEHGNSEHDRGPFDYYTHSMGGRQTSNTARAALDAGLRFGFVGSSDDHAGFPGAYGEGLMAALVTDQTRAGILEAINARRTYALTGDRIEIDFSANGAPMGASIDAGRQLAIEYTVQGRDELDVVELIQDGHVVHRAWPGPDQASVERSSAASSSNFDAPIQLRLEWGWGPWGALALDRICDWAFDVKVMNGRLLRHFPCLQSMPFDEQRRHRFDTLDGEGLRVRSYTARQNAYRENPNQSLVLEIDGDASTEVSVTMREPYDSTQSVSLGELVAGSRHHATGPFPKEYWQWHRLVARQASRVTTRVMLDLPDRRSYVYLRARQTNGQMAWASPVFIGSR